MQANWRLYRARAEPQELRDGSKYVDLRSSRDVARLQALEQILADHSPDAVLVPWISPPYGVIKGYGVYSRKEAEQLYKRSKEEHWGFPDVGAGYDLSWIRRRIAKLSEHNHVSISR